MNKNIIAITGAYSYTGRYVAEAFLKLSPSNYIINLTNHPNRSWKFTDPFLTNRIQDFPLKF
jgi:hypothetical protein